jgi:hypothetical protein
MVVLRAFAVWIILMAVESVHGIFRRLLLERWVGDFAAREIGVFTGSVLILIVTYLLIDWISATTTKQLTVIGVMWVGLTLAFEIGIGRLAFEYSWERVLSDFNIARGGLLGIGLFILGCAPRIAASLRRVRASSSEVTVPFPETTSYRIRSDLLRTRSLLIVRARHCGPGLCRWAEAVEAGTATTSWIIAGTAAPTGSFRNSRRSR